MALITVAALMGYVRFYVDTKRQCKLDNRLNINSVGFEWLRRDYHNLIQIWTVLSRTRLRTIRDTLTYVNGHSSREPEMLFLRLIPRFPCLYWSTVGTGTAKPVDKSIAGTFCIIRRSAEQSLRRSNFMGCGYHLGWRHMGSVPPNRSTNRSRYLLHIRRSEEHLVVG